MHLRQLEYFYVLAQMEHCTKASEKLYITQPSLSHAISELEKELGTQLFERVGRNINLNKYGRSFFPHVEKALAELKLGEKELLKMSDQNKGQIDLGYICPLSFHFVPSIVSAFLSNPKHQKIRFTFGQGTTQDLISDLKEEKYDLVLSSYIENDTDIDFTPIAQEELVVIVSKNHPLAKLHSITLEETKLYPYILFSKSSGLRAVIDNVLKEVSITPIVAFETETDTAVAGLVEANLGIAIIPKMPSLKTMDLKVIKIKNHISKRFIYIANIKNRSCTSAVSLFHSFVINYLKENHVKI
ncbi:LysR family transcriptional regulator [Clostridium estertheticum]|uniref:LysR family transcriptional regulator n=1 Tax=Clostridium estertheticum TaxID=238834 RepID=UPI001C0AF52A|nr:LysR family transcriptional regulator [Clostridium estertheticum]MBU3202035.1 LysR family transcriptional regulator [Clostridium estertheticum]WAG67743.1 LysR family transcriptional regulator [Clostridium estertheticum]